MATINITTRAGRIVSTACRTPKGVVSAWAAGRIDIAPADWDGARMHQGGRFIGVLDGVGYVLPEDVAGYEEYQRQKAARRAAAEPV